MSVTQSALWPWLALAGLGLFHGVNPAMGWLFAVALGLHRNSERVVFLSLAPIALGHAAAILVVLAVALGLGLIVDYPLLARIAGLVLLAWALWHATYGHRGPVRVGMQTGLAGLVIWSFMMATAHGAGLMLIPAVMSLCRAAAPAVSAEDSLPIAAAALAVHTGVMLATIGAVSLLVYRWAGLEFLRRGWINLDRLWIAALIACSAWLLVS